MKFGGWSDFGYGTRLNVSGRTPWTGVVTEVKVPSFSEYICPSVEKDELGGEMMDD
jgi:hypothetical protein